MSLETYNWYNNFSERSDLEVYESNALLLYSLQIKYGIEDIHSEAANSLLDGNDDKKIDLLYYDEVRQEIVLSQGYYTNREITEAPANKASDLNTAVSWLLTRDIADLPERLKSPAQEIRDRIISNEVKKFTVWYSHNCPESENVRQELQTAVNTANAILTTEFNQNDIDVSSIEVGRNILENWYSGLTIPILVTDEINIPNVGGYKLEGNGWETFVSHVPAAIIKDLYDEHGTDLFSANVRDYLGSRKSDSNINNGIKRTASNEPGNFFVYNNGITAIVNGFEYDSGGKNLTIRGISIVNGAQTSGAIGTLPSEPNEDLNISIRYIKCSNPDTIVDIVKFNNSQNKITAPDFRSSDPVQRRIEIEFEEIENLDYSSRRGGAADIIRRNPNIIPSVTAGQILAAFHGDAALAYNQKSKIFQSDSIYPKYFNDQTTAKHIFFTYALRKAIEYKKQELVNKETLTALESELLSYFKVRGSLVVFMTAISKCMEQILGEPIPSKFLLKFCDIGTLEDAIIAWNPIVEILSSFSGQLKTGLSDGIKSISRLEEGLTNFEQMIAAIKTANQEAFNEFKTKVCQ